MAHDGLGHLAGRIRGILTGPGVDYSVVSAKRVRKALIEGENALDPAYVKEHKESLDELIAKIYNSIVTTNGAADHSTTSSKRKRSDSEDVETTKNHVDNPLPHSKGKRVKNEQDDAAIERDAEIARQLAHDMNSRERTTRNGSAAQRSSKAGPSSAKTGTKGARRGAGKSKIKSPSKIIDSDASDDEDNDDDDAKTAPKKKRKSTASGEGGRARGGFLKEFILSGPLAAVCEEPRMARTKVVKALWTYIKANQLQNPRNGREILCDDKLRDLFRQNKIDMFTMNKVLGSHLIDPDDAQ